MRILRKIFLFGIGGAGYMVMELLWRGWSHGSMFLAGGSCFLLLGKLNNAKPQLPFLVRAAVGAGIITMVEYAAGLLVNRDYAVWDYRNTPLNLHGQICLPFCLLWLPIGLCGMYLYSLLDKKILPVD